MKVGAARRRTWYRRRAATIQPSPVSHPAVHPTTGEASMKFTRSRRTIIVAAIVLIGTPTAWLFARPAADAGNALVAEVTKGDFAVTVTTAGELRASSAVNIQGPAEMQRAGA